MLGYYQDIKAKGGNKLISGKAELPFEPYVMTYQPSGYLAVLYDWIQLSGL